MLRFGKYVVVLLIWNLRFESLHLQLIFPKGKCLCIWLLMNVEKIRILSYKKAKQVSTTVPANADPAPLPSCHQHALPCLRQYNCNSRTRWDLETL